ncbi:MAG TPA: alpha/beta hydrolase [Kofleriaceae bacterium]|nr:alpha/beta hydrolase [Kofleriaceae bacterium]
MNRSVAVDRLVRVLARAGGVASREVDTGVVRHHAYVAPGRGRLPPIVWLHGLADSGTTFLPVMRRLRPHVHSVTILEAGGHGLSSAPRTEYTPAVHLASMTQALDMLIREPAILVGNSLGGSTALKYALARPERVRGLVLVSPAGAPLDDDATEQVRTAFALTTPDDARRFLDRVFVERPPLAGLLARKIAEQASRPAVRDILRTASSADAPTPDELGAITVPTWLLWGRAERLLPPSMLTYLRAHLPAHALVASPDGFGHCPHLDQPGRLARLILSFAELSSTTRVRLTPQALQASRRLGTLRG